MTTKRDSVPPLSYKNVEVPTTRPEIPWVDLRRFRQLVVGTELDATASKVRESTEAPIYPFTSGQQLLNDGVGFGEEISERRVPGNEDAWGKERQEIKQFRRTRSGKIPIDAKKEPSFLLGLKGRDK